MKTESARASFLRRTTAWLICLAVISGLAYYSYSFSTGEERMVAICNRIKPGMNVGQLAALAAEHDLGPVKQFRPDATLAYLAETRTMGRHACRVELKDGVVTQAAHSFSD